MVLCQGVLLHIARPDIGERLLTCIYSELMPNIVFAFYVVCVSSLIAFLQNKALVSKIVMIAIPGLEAELFTAKQV